MRQVAEFQGFVRDLHDLGVQHLVGCTGAPSSLVAILTNAMTAGRSIDSGNATMTSMRIDFDRIGVRKLENKLAAASAYWDKDSGTDPARFNGLVQVRNALAHGNAKQIINLRRQGYNDTITWGRAQMPVLNRLSRALDRIVWDQLTSSTGVEPW